MSDQEPATPGTAARCEVCGRGKCATLGYARDGDRRVKTENWCNHWRLGYERLKAENASLLESLRAAEHKFHFQQALVQGAHRAFHETGLGHGSEEEFNPAAQIRIVATAKAAAEQRAEAAEKSGDLWMIRAEAAEQRAADLMGALEESVKLQSHYAELINMHDGGARIGFADANAWLARIGQTKARAALHDEERSAPPRGEDGK